MDSLKRKANEENMSFEKKPKKEACPHAETCYRRNPHHFREYEHEHLNKYLTEEITTFPSSFTQNKTIYVEQIEIMRGLKPLRKPTVPIASNNIIDKNTPNKAGGDKKKIVENKPNTPIKASVKDVSNLKAKVNTKDNPMLKAKPSTSSKPNSPKKMVKTTTFVPNSKILANKNSNKRCDTMIEKLEFASPYNIFFTKVPKAYTTLDAKNGVSFPDLICPSLGSLKCSLQFNFMIDVSWLVEQYDVHGLGKKPLTILYGYEFPRMEDYIKMKLPNVSYHYVKMKDPFGCHHSKIGLYEYEDGTIRIVISTANLYYEDWNLYNQGLWMSPALPKMPESKQDYECAGPTAFKSSLITYLNTYNLPLLKDWISLIKRADFSEVKVFFVSSTPGKHYPKDPGCHLHRIGDLLTRHVSLPPKTTPQSEGPLSWGVIAQASSIGSLGKNAGDWLRSILLRSLASHKNGPLPSNSSASLSIVFPTGANVMYSHFGAEGGGCLPYSKTVNDKQKWLQSYLHQWKSDALGRSKAMPHIKSYCRVSPCLTKLAYYLLTSSNISKAAWGGNIQKDSGCYIRSYEAGVLFLPSFFDEEYFTIKKDGDDEKVFPFIYDLPLTPYTSKDEPWCN